MLEEQIVEPCLVDSAPEIYWRFLPQTRDIKSGAWMVCANVGVDSVSRVFGLRWFE